MNLHEHQAKELLSLYGVPIQRGMVLENIYQLQSISLQCAAAAIRAATTTVQNWREVLEAVFDC